MYRSSDNGETWSSILPDIGAYGNILKILCLGDTIFASQWMDNASVIRSTDNGQTWSMFFFIDNSVEYISDIIKSNSGDIYISLKGYFANMGGVYKSEDGGDNWDFIGLFNYQVSSLALNDADDLFAGSWGGLSDTTSSGLYVLRNGVEEWQTLLANPQVSDIIINSENEIYFSNSWPNGVVRSLDNGETFELINGGLPDGMMRDMFLDTLGYLYVTNINCLAKSISPTITGIESEPLINHSYNFQIFPNPASDRLTIIFNENFNHKNEEIIVFNTLGIEVKQVPVFQNVKEIVVDVSKLEAGLYFTKMKVEGVEVATRKFLVVR